MTETSSIAGPVADAIKEEGEVQSPDEKEEILKALEWSTKLQDSGILESLRHSLPAQILREQVMLYKIHLASPATMPAVADRCLVAIDPGQNLCMRNLVALRLDEYLRDEEFVDASPLPRHSLDDFLMQHCKINLKYKKIKQQ